MADKKQQLVLSIIDFLSASVSDGTVKSDDKEGLDVAIQCIGEAFGVDPDDASQRQRLSIAPATLPTIFDVFLKTRDKMGSGSGAAPTPVSATSAAASGSKSVSTADKASAEALKATGNSAMSKKQYDSAIESYTAAIALDPSNPVYYSNRAAAHSSTHDHYSAIEDAQMALKLDPNFSKAYSRMGHAYYCLEDYDEALNSFQKGLALDPTNENLKTGVDNSRAKVATSSTSTRSPPAAGATPGSSGGMPDLSSLMGMFGGGGAGAPGAGGGMPDIASILQNPQMMAMAQSMMANGGMEAMMSNPSVRSMAERVQSGGGMPSMAELMSDPAMRDLASRFGGAGSGAPPGNV